MRWSGVWQVTSEGQTAVGTGTEGGPGKAGSCDVSEGVPHRDRMSTMDARTHRVSQAACLSEVLRDVQGTCSDSGPMEGSRL